MLRWKFDVAFAGRLSMAAAVMAFLAQALPAARAADQFPCHQGVGG